MYDSRNVYIKYFCISKNKKGWWIDNVRKNNSYI